MGRGHGAGSGAGSRASMYGSGGGRSSGPGPRKVATLCSNCQAPLSPDEVLLGAQTEGRCTACQQMVEAQSACRVCHLPWSNGQQDVVPCDACGFFMHENCVKKGALQTKSGGRVLTYCPHCPPGSLPVATAAATATTGGGGGQGKGAGRSVQASQRQQRVKREEQEQPSLDQPGSLPLALQGLVRPPSSSALGRSGLAPPGSALSGPLSVTPAAMQHVAAMLQGQLRLLQNQQAELLQQYQQQLRALMPPPPKGPFHLFELDMLRVYQEEGFDIDPDELQPVIANAWSQLTQEERVGYEGRAANEYGAWRATAQLYVQLYGEYEMLASHVGVPPDTSLLPEALQEALQEALAPARLPPPQMAAAPSGRSANGSGTGRGPGRPPGSYTGIAAARQAAAAAAEREQRERERAEKVERQERMGSGGSGGGRGTKRPALDALVGASALLGMGRGQLSAAPAAAAAPAPPATEDDDDEDYEAEGVATKRRRAVSPASASGGAAAAPASRPAGRSSSRLLPADKLPTCVADLPQQLNVSCNDVSGTFIMDGIKVLCHCKECAEAPRAQREFHPTHWEQHCGAGTAKKWKASIKIEPGGAPEVPDCGNAMQIGKWFDMLGVEFRPAKTTGGPPGLEFTGASIKERATDGDYDSPSLGGGAPTPPPPAPPAPAPLPVAKPPRLHQPTPPPRSMPPLSTYSGRRGEDGGPEDGFAAPAVTAIPSSAATAKPSRPVSGFGGASVVAGRMGADFGGFDAVASIGKAPGPLYGKEAGRGRGSGRGGAEGGEYGESSSRGSASDTVGLDTTS